MLGKGMCCAVLCWGNGVCSFRLSLHGVHRLHRRSSLPSLPIGERQTTLPVKNFMLSLKGTNTSAFSSRTTSAQDPRNRNCISCGVNFSMATSSPFTVPWIICAFFSCNMTMRLSMLSSTQRRVMTQGRRWPIRWQRSADCHSAAGFHQLPCVSALCCSSTRGIVERMCGRLTDR